MCGHTGLDAAEGAGQTTLPSRKVAVELSGRIRGPQVVVRSCGLSDGSRVKIDDEGSGASVEVIDSRLTVEVGSVCKEGSLLLVVVGLIDGAVIGEARVVRSVTVASKSSPIIVGVSRNCSNECFVLCCSKLSKLIFPVRSEAAVAVFKVEPPSRVFLKCPDACVKSADFAVDRFVLLRPVLLSLVSARACITMVHSANPVIEVAPHGLESVSLGCKLIDLLLPGVIDALNPCVLGITEGSVRADLRVDVVASCVLDSVQLRLRSCVRVLLACKVSTLPGLVPGVFEALAVCVLCFPLNSQAVDVGVVLTVSTNSRKEVNRASDASLLSGGGAQETDTPSSTVLGNAWVNVGLVLGVGKITVRNSGVPSGQIGGLLCNQAVPGRLVTGLLAIVILLIGGGCLSRSIAQLDILSSSVGLDNESVDDALDGGGLSGEASAGVSRSASERHVLLDGERDGSRVLVPEEGSQLFVGHAWLPRVELINDRLLLRGGEVVDAEAEAVDCVFKCCGPLFVVRVP